MTTKNILSLTIIIPTFNEVDNIEEIIKRIQLTLFNINYKILFIDDNSADGTANRIKKIQELDNKIDLIVRFGRRGLASACIEGILHSKSDLIVVMDCDLQHDEKIIPEMYDFFKKHPKLDLVIGSRHIDKGKASTGFSKIRDIGSRVAIKLTNSLLNINISDPMSGFFMLKRSSILSSVEKLQHSGFKILADILALNRGKLNIKEIGYKFRKRLSGESKMSFKIVIELIALILSHLSFRLLSVRFILFGIVGTSGILVQLFSTFILMNIAEFGFLLAHILSVMIAMTSNFTLNNFITFNEKSLLGTNYFRGLISFYIVCSVGALLNVAVADFLFSNLGIWVIASLIGALLGALWNFMLSSIFTWQIR